MTSRPGVVSAGTMYADFHVFSSGDTGWYAVEATKPLGIA